MLNLAYEKFNDKPYSLEESNSIIKNPTSVSVLVDISGSMIGFSRTRTTFNQFLDKLNYSFGDLKIKYYSFSTELKLHKNYLAFLNPEIFHGQKTYYSLIDSIVSDENIAVILADLQFNTIQYYDDLIVIFQNLVRNKIYIKIYAATIEFDGPIYPQMVGGEIPFNYKGVRPIYIIAVGNSQHKKFINNILSNVNIWNHQISFIKYSESDLFVYNLNNDFEDYERIQNLRSTKLIHASSPAELSSHIEIRNNNFKDWPTIDKNNITAKAYYKKPDTDSILFEDNSISFETKNIRLIADNLEFDLISNSLNPCPMKLIRITIEASIVPSWVDSLSCNENEGPKAQKNRTLRLRNFFEGIISNRINPFIISSVYIVIK